MVFVFFICTTSLVIETVTKQSFEQTLSCVHCWIRSSLLFFCWRNLSWWTRIFCSLREHMGYGVVIRNDVTSNHLSVRLTTSSWTVADDRAIVALSSSSSSYLVFNPSRIIFRSTSHRPHRYLFLPRDHHRLPLTQRKSLPIDSFVDIKRCWRSEGRQGWFEGAWPRFPRA